MISARPIGGASYCCCCWPSPATTYLCGHFGALLLLVSGRTIWESEENHGSYDDRDGYKEFHPSLAESDHQQEEKEQPEDGPDSPACFILAGVEGEVAESAHAPLMPLSRWCQTHHALIGSRTRRVPANHMQTRNTASPESNTVMRSGVTVSKFGSRFFQLSGVFMSLKLKS